AAQRNRCLALRDTVVKLQAWWRGASAAAGYRRTIATVVLFQVRLRGAAVLARYRRLVAATVVVQSRRRGAVAATSYRRMRAAALTTQSARRGAPERRRLALLADRALSIQAWWRMATAVAFAREQRCSAVRLQAAWRGRSARTAYRRGIAGYIGLQAVWRGRSARTVYRRGVVGYVRLQAVMRGAGVRARLARERRQVAELEVHARTEAAAAAAQIQAWYRRHVVARRLHAEAELLRAAAVALRIAAGVELQAFVRGYLARRGFRAARSAPLRGHRVASDCERPESAGAQVAPFRRGNQDTVGGEGGLGLGAGRADERGAPRCPRLSGDPEDMARCSGEGGAVPRGVGRYDLTVGQRETEPLEKQVLVVGVCKRYPGSTFLD
ncbi:unnamed protein product, partial [Scytosiphon promiscuus]